MNKIKMKAKAGVTLVELLVVVLIVTILSVSMLPLLLPFVTEAQYAAEAIPVIGNIRTKIGVYLYDKGKLPFDEGKFNGGGNEVVQTWIVNQTDKEKYDAAYVQVASASSTGSTTPTRCTTTGTAATFPYHIGSQVDIDYQDLKGKRSKPLHYQYCALSPSNNTCYVVGCFGDGNGLKAGTGYAVCEFNFVNRQKKYIGTWKRYKPVKENQGAITFTNNNAPNSDGKYENCFIPSINQLTTAINANAAGEPDVIGFMRACGWEF